MPTCGHGNKGHFQCQDLSRQDVRKIHQKFYEQPDHQWQNNFIIQHVSVVTPKRICTPAGIPSRRKVSTHFSLPKRREDVVENVRVCRAAFLDILQVGRDRVNRVCKTFLTTGSAPVCETRGGDRRSHKYVNKREAVKHHIKTFKPLQSHYCRGKHIQRQYLPSDLSVQKMWSMYTEQNPDNLHVQYEYYRSIFNEEFNIGFGSPCVDKCSTCTQLESRISAERNTPERNNLSLQLKVHKKRADVFYQKLREEMEHEITLSYDCQKNLVLPKIPDQAAYYARQLYLYNFTICQGSSKSLQTRDNTFCYIWTENEYSKGSNQIASAVHHRLSNMNMGTSTTVRLFSDGCGGQNKNKTMIAMMLHWLLFDAPSHIEQIEVWFPIVGHSFIPPDRVFGNLEREFHRHSVIQNPDDYMEMIKGRGTLSHLGKDCAVKDWKAYGDEMLKNPASWHFQFQKSKKIVITKNKGNTSALVRGEPFFNFESGEPKSLCKRGKSFRQRHISEVPRGLPVKSAKLCDVKRLLVLHFGDEWARNPKLEFFKNVFEEQVCLQSEGSNEEESNEDPLDFDLMEGDETAIA